MSISVEGQYHYKFSLGDQQDFIAEDDFLSFDLLEEAGNVLPSFRLNFNTYDDSILSRLHEGNTLEVSFGKSSTDLVTSSLSPLKLEAHGMGSDKKLIGVTGVYSRLPYIVDSKQSISKFKSGVEVIKDIVSPSFTPDFNIEKSLDKQHWIQPNINNKLFVNEVWTHLDLADSFVVVGISSDGKFILKDIKETLKGDFDWRFINSKSSSKDIPYDPDYNLRINTGFMNNWVGYGREKLVYNLEEDSQEFVKEIISPILALTRQLARRQDIDGKFVGAGTKNENTHENYHESFQKNLLRLVSFGNVEIDLSFTKTFIPIRVLDLVMFRDTNSSQHSQVSTYHSGLYFVTKVMRTIQHRQLVTVVTLSRESLNELRIN